jgi:hypothetical protein
MPDLQPPRHHFFDPWLSTRPTELLGADLGPTPEAIAGLDRQRRLKAADRGALQSVLHAVLANALYVVAALEATSFAVSLRRPSAALTRYGRPGFASLPKVLDAMERHGLLTVSRSRRRGTASTVQLSASCVSRLQAIAVGPESFTWGEGAEIVLLNQTNSRDYVAGTRDTELVDYADTPLTLRYREEVACINAHLTAADLAMFTGADQPSASTVNRRLRRYFSQPLGEAAPRFDLGGRLFGGWWQNLPSDDRRLIRIDGEPIADLDFASMALRLAYLEAGAEPPEGDLYAAIPGLTGERWRPIAKMAVLSMLSRTGPLQRPPRGCAGHLPPGMKAAGLRAAILSAHPLLAPIFETGLGMRLQFTESQILMLAMLRLIEFGVTALPMHDGLMVAGSKAGLARDTMQDAAESVVGFRLPVVLKSQ